MLVPENSLLSGSSGFDPAAQVLVEEVAAGRGWPFAHIFVLWVAPQLALMALWLVGWHRVSGNWWSGNALLFALVWAGLCVRWLGPPATGRFGQDQGRLWAGALYWRLQALSRWGVILGLFVLACWWRGWGPLMALGLLAAALLVWAPLLCQRVWIGEAGVWALGRDLRYVAFGSVREAGWDGPYRWLAAPEAGWPTQVWVPNEAAAEALESAFVQCVATSSPGETNAPPGLWQAAPRGQWRRVLAFCWGLLWCGWWGWAVWGADVRIAKPWTLYSLLLLLLGVVVAVQWSRWLPTWGRLGWGAPVWRVDDPASRLYLRAAMPLALVALGLSGYVVWQQLTSPALFFAVNTCLGALCLASTSLFVLADPTGCVAWVCRQDERWFVRRYGWVEEVGKGFWEK